MEHLAGKSPQSEGNKNRKRQEPLEAGVQDRELPEAEATRGGNPQERPDALRAPRSKKPWVVKAALMQPMTRARPEVRGHPQERPKDETWLGKELSIAHAPTGSAASTEPWRSPGKNGALQPQESSRTKESRGKSHQEATRGPPPSHHRKYRSPKGGGPRHKKRMDKESQPTGPPKNP